jgi:hypothetical protein
MGEIAEMILMGFLCQTCGMPIDNDAVGYPRCCENCTCEEKETER